MNAFSRLRRLPFEALVLFIVQKSSAPPSVCLSDFFQDQSKAIPTRSSFSQARVKAFKRLNMLFGQAIFTSRFWSQENGQTLDVRDLFSLGRAQIVVIDAQMERFDTSEAALCD